MLLIMNFLITFTKMSAESLGSYFDNVVMKFMINNRTETCKSDVNFLFYKCWRALLRQHTILYNSEKKAKSVGWKIEDMHSRLCFLYPGIPGCL